MARKAKKRMHRMPPLSFVDKITYWFLFLLLWGAYLTLMLGPLHLRRLIAFSDEFVAAAEDNISILWLGVPWMTFFLMTFILSIRPYQDRKPIFGKRNFKYGPPAWPKVYPLFMKNKPYVFVSEQKKKNQKKIATLLLTVLLISFIPLPWSLYGRDCLHNDGSIVQYNMFNQQVHHYSSGEIEEIKIETYGYRTGKYYISRHWSVRMVFITNSGKKYTFEQREFRDGIKSSSRYWLEAMANIKQRYNPQILSYEGVDELDRIAVSKNLSSEETQQLYQLFGQ